VPLRMPVVGLLRPRELQGATISASRNCEVRTSRTLPAKDTWIPWADVAARRVGVLVNNLLKEYHKQVCPTFRARVRELIDYHRFLPRRSPAAASLK